MIFDCITFSGEYDMLEIRFNLLRDVDKFIIVEGIETFSGKPKPMFWPERDKERFKQWEDKVVYHIVSAQVDQGILEQMKDRADYVNQPAFRNAFYQKETIRKVLEVLNPDDEDVIYYGDCDEVPKLKIIDDKVYKLRQLAYSYYLNNRSPEDWRGTIITKWKNLKNACLNDMRANPVNIVEDGGWHWTNLGGLEAVVKKIESYDHQEVNNPWVKDGLAERMAQNNDFLGRGYQFWTDESGLPQYILDNKEKYKKIWKS